MADMLANEEHTKDLGKKEFQLAQMLMAVETLHMAEFGVLEEEEHSSLIYCEEHADELFQDGGKSFQEKMDIARAKGRIHNLTYDSTIVLEKLGEEVDTEVKLRLMQQHVRTMDAEVDALRALQGLPPETRDDMFIGTLIDDELFAPAPPPPDCPICFLPLPERGHITYNPCCGKSLCDGCIIAHRESSKEYNCPFCRSPVNIPDEKRIEQTKKRFEANDSEAFYMIGGHCLQGSMGEKKDTQKALEYFKKASELGLNAAHHSLGCLYECGIVVEKDEKKALHYYRLGAIGGMLESRFALGLRAYNAEKQNVELAMKHWVMAAGAGHDKSLEYVKFGYEHGCVTKDVFAKTLRAHKAASDETKSDQRDAAMSSRERASHTSS